MRSHVLIHLSSTRIRLTSVRGAESRESIIDVDRSVGRGAWANELRSLDDALAEAVCQMECAGADAVALYNSPTAIVDLHHAPAAGHDALQAAQLALRDAAHDRASSDPASFIVLGRDHDGEPRQTHVLGVIEDAATAQTVIDFVERAGLRCRAILPASASMIAASVMDALEHNDPTTIVRLRIEEDCSALTASQQGRLLMYRRIDFGVDRIVEAMTRPILRGPDEITLSEQEARDLVQRIGIPSADDVIDDSRGLRGADILPIIQPVLQRLVVEVKQSLRFSLSDEQRHGLTLRLTGAGGAVKRLGDIIGTETDAPMEPAETQDAAGPQDAPAARAAFAERLALLPPAALHARVSRRIRRGLLAGATLAGALLAADAAWSVWITRSMDQHIASLEEVTERIRTTREQHATAEQDFITARTAAAAAPGAMPPRAHWGAWLAELSRLTPAKVRLSSVSGGHEAEAARVAMHGVVSAIDSDESRVIITHFVDALRNCPLVERVELGGIRRSADASGAQEFDLNVRLATAPVEPPQMKEAQP